LGVWGNRPISDITDLDILSVVRSVKRRAPAQARNLLGIAKRLFSWAVEQKVYGLKASPAGDLKPTKILGEKRARARVLSDLEVFAFWRAASRLPYPHGPVYRLLILTAVRLNEVADASRGELNLDDQTWVIPAARMKGRNGKARAHVVPLTSEILEVFDAVPNFKRGAFIFSTTFGESPVWISDKVKKRLDMRMLRVLRAMARKRGEDPSKVELPHWTNHDIRRTVRSNLSKLKISEEAREALLAHARPGIKGTYDHHDYLDEKREALELWAARLRSITTPAPTNVVTLTARA
jgi:integrase